MMPFALITGGSKGIGQCIATELAARKYNLLLVARDASLLSAHASYISEKYGIQFNDLDDADEHDYKNRLCEYELIKDIPNYDREQILDYIESTGRGRTYWEEQDDEQLQISFEHIWAKQFEEN